MDVVTGSNGSIGNVLVRELLKRGRTVRGFSRPTSDIKSLEGLEVEKVVGNIQDVDSLIKSKFCFFVKLVQLLFSYLMMKWSRIVNTCLIKTGDHHVIQTNNRTHHQNHIVDCIMGPTGFFICTSHGRNN